MKVFYICTDPYTPVVQSQIVETVSGLSANGVDIKIIFILQTQHYFDKKARARDILSRQGVKFATYWLPLQTKKIGAYIAAFWLLLNVFWCPREKVIFQCRGLKAAGFANTFKSLIGKVKVIYDVRGDYLSEAGFQGWAESYLNVLEDRERECITTADHYLCVSNSLQSVLKQRYDLQTSSDVLFCSASIDKVKFNLNARNRIRSDFDLSDKKVIVYSGSIGKWHCFDQVLRVCEVAGAKDKDVRFLFLTNQKDQARELIDNSAISEKAILTSAAHDEIGDYLSAADAAIIIREPHPLNFVASPVKVAEYILNGLPLIISDAIYDYSQMVMDAGFGIAISHDELNDDQALEDIFTDFHVGREDYIYPENIQERLTKDFNFKRLIKLYETI